MRELVGSGVFGWEGAERRTNRYGAMHLSDRPYDGKDRAKLHIDREVLSRLEGKRVRLTVKVTATRESGHVGDLALRIFPERPAEGEVIDLGVGILAIEPGYDGTPDLALWPGDGRKAFWMDPRKLYRLHDQSVEVYLEETTDAFSPVPCIRDDKKGQAHDTGDGHYQVKHVEEGDKVLPAVRSLGDGAFLIDHTPGKGMPLGVAKKRDRS